MIRAERIRISHMKEPLGIDIENPVISWSCTGGERQTAYRIEAIGNCGTSYDSGVVESSVMSMKINAAFKSRERVTVRVHLFEQAEETVEETFFEMGLRKEDWQAKWINPELVIPDATQKRPASYLYNRFLADPLLYDSIKNARLYITCHGIYNVYINGRHLKGFVMAPGTSEYETLLQYQTYDISEYLNVGENEILICLGNGWWRGTTGYDGIKNGFGNDVSLLAQLEINKNVVCITDNAWQATQAGPLLDTDNMSGEIYDARHETTISFMQTRIKEESRVIDDGIWHRVRIEEFGFDNLCCSNCPPPIEHEIFEPILYCAPNGDKILDFGQNITGYIQFEIQGISGDTYKFTHGETLDGWGNFCMSNFQSPHFWCAQEITYICKDGLNTYKPTNTFMGFRYVKVEGMSNIRPEQFRAYAVYSDLEETIQFSCGNKLVNQLFQNALWSLKGNLLDIPTDCPTREKSGFSGDLVTFGYTFLYMMDCYPMLRKFIRNQATTQYKDGCIKQIIADPRERGWFDGAAGWCDSFEIIPTLVGERYHDYELFEDYYEEVKRWVDFIIRRAAHETRPFHMDNPYHQYLEDMGIHWGEWAEPGMEFESYLKNILENGEPEVGTAYLSYACQLLSAQAKRMERNEDARYYNNVAIKARSAYRFEFLSDGKIVSDRMCRYIRPIALHLLTEDEKKDAAKALNQLVIDNDFTLNTGFLTTHELCRTLSDYGYTKTAYALLLNEKSPGWLHSVKNGATTILENWNGYQEDGRRKDSFNHYSYGSIAGWLIDTAAGIRVKNGLITIAPKPCYELKTIKVIYQSPLGMIESSWKYSGDTIVYHVEIPCNCKAELILLSGEKQILKPGRYVFVEPLLSLN